MTPVLVLSAALLLADPAAQTAASGTSSAGLAAAAQASATPAVISTWLGVSLGEASKDVRAQLGKPRTVVPSNVGDRWRYDADNGNVTLELVVNQSRVVNIAARVNDGKQSSLADPFGGALGMTTQALQGARGTPIATYDNGGTLAYGDPKGVRWFYSIDNGAVSAIEVSNPLPAVPAAQVTVDAAHDGSTLTKALLVSAPTQTDATNAEMDYLQKLPCGGGGTWQVIGQELVPAGGRYFDLLHVSCSTTKLPRDYYFDITSSFGK